MKDLANHVYSAENRLTEVRNSAGNLVHQFSYDLQGNITSRNSVPHDFDFGNRLRAVPGIEDYRYDGSGRRVQTTKAGGARTLWMYAQSGQMLFSSKLPATGGQTTHENVYLGGSLVATIDHAWPSNAILATKYQHTDALGSPVAVTNESGAVIERTNFDPYGGAIGKAVDGIGYTGHVMDPATGLTYMQQRYYDQGVGRFLSVDPVTVSSINGGNFNRYWYANNSPYKFMDPDGRFAMTRHKGFCAMVGACLGGSGGSGGRSRAEAEQQADYEEAQANPEKRDAFVKRMHKRNRLTGTVPDYEPTQKAPGSYDENSRSKQIGPSAFSFPNAADLGSILIHEGGPGHEGQAESISDYTSLKHTNARNVLEHNAFSAELSPVNPFRSRLSEAYLKHVEFYLGEFYRSANAANKEIIDAGQSCATAYCSGD